jgi:hypothetical protein
MEARRQGPTPLHENFRPASCASSGIDYDVVSKFNPGLIYASMSGFGQTGSLREERRLRYRGARHVGHHDDDRLSRRPSGEGRHRDERQSRAAPRRSTASSALYRQAEERQRPVSRNLSARGGPRCGRIGSRAPYFGGGELPTATGTRHRRSTPYQAYKTKDGYVTVGANNNKLWSNFCTMVCSKPEWLTDKRFATLPARLKNIDELEKEIEAVFAAEPIRRTGSRSSTPQRFPAARFIPTTRSSPTRTSKRATWVVEMEHPIIAP